MYGRPPYPTLGTPRSEGAEEGNACRRPNCTNNVPDMSMNGFCSNDCVLGQSRDVYNNWSGGSHAHVGASAPPAATPSQPMAAAR